MPAQTIRLDDAAGPAWLARARFARLSIAVRDLSAARSHDAIIDITRRAAREITGALGVTIVLREGDYCRYIAEDSDIPLWKGQAFPITDCISGWAMRHGEQVVVSDIYQDHRIPHAAYRPTSIHSLVMTPVGEPEAIAALGAYWSEVRDAAPDETAALAALASCMATALQNIELVSSLQTEVEHKQLLINELNHRVKNSLAIVHSLSSQSLRGERPLSDARADFESRLRALAGAHALMTEAAWRAVPLRELVEGTIAPFATLGDAPRIDVVGPDVMLPPKSAVAFALAVHELCTNASKYGALSRPGGRVDIAWDIVPTPGGPRLQMSWRERGGPAVIPPTATGFGSRLLERGLSAELKGEVRLRFNPTGLVCEIDAPAPTDVSATLFPTPV